MEQYIGLDVSMKETAIAIRQDGGRIWRGKCASDPQLLAALIRKRAPHARRVVFETGPLSVWFYHTLTAQGLPAICIDARHAKAALDMAPNKTDANDADGLAHLAEVGFYREVRVKGFDSMLIRTLVTARRQLLKMRVQISNQIRGLMKTFGLVIPKGAGSVFERNVRTLLQDEDQLARIVLPMLQAWRDIRLRTAELNKQLVTMASEDQRCRLLMSVPGIGTVTATAFAAAVEDPENFRNSRAVGAWVGLTPRRYQSGEVDFDGHISRRGDNQLRHLLFEAAAVILNRSTEKTPLRTWALALKFIDPESLVFLDETGVNTKMARLYGWAPVGERCRDSVPFGHGKTMTFIAGLRLTGMTAPWVLNGPMDGNAFRTYVRHVLAPTLKRGHVVVLDNLPAHKVAGIREAITTRRAQLFYLPPYSPNMNPIEMAFAKLKVLLRHEPAGTIDGLVNRIGNLLDRFPSSRMRKLLPRRQISTVMLKSL